MSQYVTARTTVPTSVDTKEVASGKIESIYLMGKPARVKLKDGFVVDSNWLARNPNAVNVFDIKKS